jgi:hypothetical protein
MTSPRRPWSWIIVLAALTGCSGPPATPAGTGAREAVRDYYDGLLRQNWQQAYAVLSADGKQPMSEKEFGRLAESYRAKLGFNPEEIRIQSCDEKGNEAFAHVVLIGQIASKQRRFKDAVVLRRSADGWRIVLPANFGK